jgi:DNA-binding transcriptional LysR family regulator
MSIELRDLRVFLAVVGQGSFGRAATELVMTQPAVSERVRHLERSVGRRLFDRTSRGASLTPAGEQFLPHARRCMTLADEAVEAVHRADGAAAFTIAIHSTFAARIVPIVLGGLHDLPRRVAIRDAHSHEVEALVLDGIADIGFALPAPRRRALDRHAIAPDAVVCVVAPGHGLERMRRPSLAALRAEVLAVNAWGDGSDVFLDRLRQAEVDDWRVRRCGDAASVIALAREHGHVAFATGSTAAPEITSGRLKRVMLAGMPRWRVRLDLLHRRADRGDDAVIAVRRALDEAGLRST